ncbi:TadA family conjugal transfer-associated ATPase [Arthrobacter sp. H20]|uniref:TadA family conjugal transfer-associated ATPase n=1 Tax=Arthrobacter sp. H20 TaxID=1267981 RepID=UPI0009DFCAE8|nr:TadA family conjugal transfer-associated ATPase [Arthrobacter sp. H20]
MSELPRVRRPTGSHDDAATTMVSDVRQAVLADQLPLTAARLAAAVQSTGKLLGSAGTLRTVDRVQAELQGLGPLQHLLADPAVTDILVNGPDEVWVDGTDGLRRIAQRFSTDAEVRALATRLISAGGRRLDDGNPCVDVRLAAFRVHAVLAPVSNRGTLLSIRVQRPREFTLGELVRSGTLDPVMAEVLRAVVDQRLNFLVSGATGTGKTTLLSTLLALSSPTERLVTVEDSAELNPRHPHAVSLQSRHGNTEGAGAVDLAELVRQALRMRPDRLIVGECRGAEVRELLTAMNTGHAGAGGTIHANAAETVPARLMALGSLAGLGREAITLQAASALDVVVHLVRAGNGRRVAVIGLVELDSASQLRVRPALVRCEDTAEHAAGWVRLQELLALGCHQ